MLFRGCIIPTDSHKIKNLYATTRNDAPQDLFVGQGDDDGCIQVLRKQAILLEYNEKQISSEEIFKGKIITVRLDQVELVNGKTAAREVVHHNGGVAVLALDEDENVLFVRQFRYPYGEVLLELPAGKLELGEDPAACGLRELEEETGYAAAHCESLGVAYPTPGYCDEVLYLYFAKDLTKTAQNLDEDEFLSVEKIPLEQAVAMCVDGTIKDAKTLAAILKFAAKR
jgi:ADP-ribose pyrophosphatase